MEQSACVGTRTAAMGRLMPAPSLVNPSPELAGSVGEGIAISSIELMVKTGIY